MGMLVSGRSKRKVGPWGWGKRWCENVTMGKVADRGRMQVNKALHTCTSCYAYAAMFSSSAGKQTNVKHRRMCRLALVVAYLPFVGRWGGGGGLVHKHEITKMWQCQKDLDKIRLLFSRSHSPKYLPPPMSIPPQGTTVPPHPGGNRHQVTVPPLGGGEPYTTPDQPILVQPN